MPEKLRNECRSSPPTPGLVFDGRLCRNEEGAGAEKGGMARPCRELSENVSFSIGTLFVKDSSEP